MLCLILLTGLALGSIADPAPPIKLRVPLKYTTTGQQIFTHKNDKKLFVANINCTNLDGAEVIVCAELPENPTWDQQKSLVFLELYDDVRNIANVSLALNITSNGPGNKPRRCATVKSWPGGELYINTHPGVVQPVSFSLGVTVTPAAPSPRPRRVSKAVGNIRSDIEQLLPFTTFYEHPLMVYDQTFLLELDVCASSSQKYDMTTTVLSTKGTFTHYICDGPCQHPDDTSVVCTSCNTGLPSCICNYRTLFGMNKVYVMVHAAGGELNPADKKYEAKFKFGAAFSV